MERYLIVPPSYKFQHRTMQVDIGGSIPPPDGIQYQIIKDHTSLNPITNNTNYSGYNETTTIIDHYNLPEKIVIGTVLGIIIFCSIAGNTLVCIAIVTQRNLRKTSNYFYVSLACADALVAAMVMTFAVANDIQGYWIFGRTYCNIWLSSDVMCSTSSILNICAISLDRYIHIRNPYHYDRIMSQKRILISIAALWLLSALISFLPIHLGWHKTEDYGSGDAATSYITGDKFICLLELNPLYAVTSSIVSFYVPCVIMIAIYIRLYLFARKHVKSIKETSAPVSFSNNMTQNETNGGGYKPSDHKAAITLGVIMGTFLVCWVPFFTINIISACCKSCVPSIVFSITTWLGYLNSMANPIIYPIFNQEFRVAFKRVLSLPKCYCDCCMKPDYGKSIRIGSTNGTSNNNAAMEYGTLSVNTDKYRSNCTSPLIKHNRDAITQL